MVRYCYLCNRIQKKNNDICLHKFPSNPIICLQWKQFCALREVDDVKALYICSSHFCTEDFRWSTSVIGKNKLLKLEAIPSIRKWQTAIGKKTEVMSEREKEYVINRNEETINDENVEPQVNVQSIAKIKIEKVEIKTETVVESQEAQTSSENILINTLNPVPCSMQKKRRYVEPLYISEVMTSDVKTPKRASRIIKFVKANDLKRQQTIKNLQRANKNLLRRIKNLESMVVYLKKKLLISEDAVDSLLI